MREQILDLLRERGPMPVYDIAQELGVDTQAVASRLAKARLSGRVHMLADQVERRRRSTGSRITVHLFALASYGLPDVADDVIDPVTNTKTSHALQCSIDRVTQKLKKRGGGPFGHLVAQMM